MKDFVIVLATGLALIALLEWRKRWIQKHQAPIVEDLRKVLATPVVWRRPDGSSELRQPRPRRIA